MSRRPGVRYARRGVCVTAMAADDVASLLATSVALARVGATGAELARIARRRAGQGFQTEAGGNIVANNGTTTQGHSTALATTTASQPSAALAFEPRDGREAFEMAGRLLASGYLPRAIQRPEQAFMIIVCGRELGLTATQSLRSIHIIEGKPTLSADLMLALTKRSPECTYFRLVESTAEIATFETQRRGEPGPTRMSFTIEEARAAGLTGKDNWKKYAAAMLRARCIASLVRAVYPDVMLSVYEENEIVDQREREPQRVAAEVVPPAQATATEAAKPAVNTDDLARQAHALRQELEGLGVEDLYAARGFEVSGKLIDVLAAAAEKDDTALVALCGFVRGRIANAPTLDTLSESGKPLSRHKALLHRTSNLVPLRAEYDLAKKRLKAAATPPAAAPPPAPSSDATPDAEYSDANEDAP